MKSPSHVPLFATPWTVAHQTPTSMAFSRQEYWSRLPFPSPEDLPNPGIEPGLLHCRQTLHCLSHQGSLCLIVILKGKPVKGFKVLMDTVALTPYKEGSEQQCKD